MTRPSHIFPHNIILSEKNWRITTKNGEGMQSHCNASISKKKHPKLARIDKCIVASHFDARWSKSKRNKWRANAYVCKDISGNKVLPGCPYQDKTPLMKKH